MKENSTIDNFFKSGTFFTGCNYWASHAGTDMWIDWRPDIVNEDMSRLEKNNVRVMRMFPNWRDFQPLRMHYHYASYEHEVRFGEAPLMFTEEGRAGIDPVMAQRFGEFCDLAKKHGIKLIVGLITGWMSGRMFVPEAFQGRKPLTDPLVIRWQVRFVRYMVRRFRNHPAIIAWDLGNECNCMQGVNHDEAYVWANTISSAIRTEDDSRPIISGMHNLSPDGVWTPEDQGEVLDVLCTHPYPLFTKYCHTDPINTMKTILHSTAESVFYSSLSGRPCFIEEAGTLGPMVADDDIAADYVRACLFSAWAHDLHGYLWWCANEQLHLTKTPYDWNAIERELGFLRTDGSEKPVLSEIKKFTDFLDSFEIQSEGGKKQNTLPHYLTDAVCILTGGQDTWGAAYGSFILAKQAGLDITFAWELDKIPESGAYLMPSVCGTLSIEGHVMADLLERVRNGATLYISLDDALLSSFSSYSGVKVKTRCVAPSEDRVTFTKENRTFDLHSRIKLALENISAKILAQATDKSPAFTVNNYGKGKVYFCAYPIEKEAVSQSGATAPDGPGYFEFYKKLGIRNKQKVAVSDNPSVCLTEHILTENTHILTVINYGNREDSANIVCKGWRVAGTRSYSGGSVFATDDGFGCTLPKDSGMAVIIEKVL